MIPCWWNYLDKTVRLTVKQRRWRDIRCQHGKWALYRLPPIFANFAAWRKGLALARRCRPPFSDFIFTCRVLCKRRKLGFTWWRHKAESNFLPLMMTTPMLTAHWALLCHMVTHMVVLLANIPVLGFQRFCSQQMMKVRFEPPPVKEKNLFSSCARSTSGSQSSSLLRITPFPSHMVPQHFIWKRADTHELAVISLPHLLKGDDSRAIFEDGRICLEKRMLEL